MNIILDTVHNLDFFLWNNKSGRGGGKNMAVEYDQSNSQHQLEVQEVPTSNSSWELAIVVPLSNCRQMQSHYIV